MEEYFRNKAETLAALDISILASSGCLTEDNIQRYRSAVEKAKCCLNKETGYLTQIQLLINCRASIYKLVQAKRQRCREESSASSDAGFTQEKAYYDAGDETAGLILKFMDSQLGDACRVPQEYGTDTELCSSLSALQEAAQGCIPGEDYCRLENAVSEATRCIVREPAYREILKEQLGLRTELREFLIRMEKDINWRVLEEGISDQQRLCYRKQSAVVSETRRALGSQDSIIVSACQRNGLSGLLQEFQYKPTGPGSRLFDVALGVATGYSDKNGHAIIIGDRIRSDSGYTGTVSFGLYGGKHFGIYVDWDQNGEWLRQDFIFWTSRSEIIN